MKTKAIPILIAIFSAITIISCSTMGAGTNMPNPGPIYHACNVPGQLPIDCN